MVQMSLTIDSRSLCSSYFSVLVVDHLGAMPLSYLHRDGLGLARLADGPHREPSGRARPGRVRFGVAARLVPVPVAREPGLHPTDRSEEVQGSPKEGG